MFPDYLPDLTGEGDDPPRTVIYDDAARRVLDEWLNDPTDPFFDELDKIIRYIEWQLSHNPANEYSWQGDEPPLLGKWLFKVSHWRKKVLVVYSFDNHYVTIHYIRIS